MTNLTVAYGGRNDPTGVGLALDLDNRSILPLSLVHLRATRAPGTNDVALSWIRRSRADANGWGVSDAPLEHTPEAYQLVIYNGVTAVRTLELTAASATYTGTQQVADFGALPASFSYTVAQRSAVHGTGHPASATFTA